MKNQMKLPSVVRKLSREIEDSENEEDEHSYPNVKIMDALESKFLEDDEIAFLYKDNHLVTPFHKSITNLMEVFKLKLSRMAYRGDIVIETYCDEKRNNVFITYNIRESAYSIKGSNAGLIIKGKSEIVYISNSLILDPYVEVYSPYTNQSTVIDLWKIIKFYSKNNFWGSVEKIIAQELEEEKNLQRIYV